MTCVECGEHGKRKEAIVIVCLYFHLTFFYIFVFQLFVFCLLTCVEKTMKEQMQPRRPKKATTAKGERVANFFTHYFCFGQKLLQFFCTQFYVKFIPKFAIVFIQSMGEEKLVQR